MTLGTGCTDVRSFQGSWSGSIVSDPELREGFSESARGDELRIERADLHAFSALLTSKDGRFADASLRSFSKVAGDAISNLTFAGDPLRSYLTFVDLADPEGATATAIVSLFDDDRVEWRVMWRRELFGLFKLSPR